MIARIQRSESGTATWQAAFEALLPTIRRQAGIAFRAESPEAREELIEETVANCLIAYARLFALGKQDRAYPSALARFAIAQVRSGRRAGGRLRIGDVLSPYAQRSKRFHVERLDSFDEQEGQWQEALVEDRRAGPAEVATSRIDFAAWLRLLSTRTRRIALTLAAGETTGGAARKFGVTPGRISQLRQCLKASWERFQTQAPSRETTRLALAG